MEQLLHYCWKHRLFPLTALTTTDGKAVEVIDPGMHNRHAGPDFFNAKVKIGQELWVGNVEIHQKASDWYAHGHQHDVHYNNVVLHVAAEVDREVVTESGRRPPQLVLPVPQSVVEGYEQLLTDDCYPPCRAVIPRLGRLMVHSFMSALTTERLVQRADVIARRADRAGGDWEQAYFITLARNYGFGVNGDAFERWAERLPLQKVGHHRDNLFQVEAFFLGQAGLLSPTMVAEKHAEEARRDGYYDRLASEYAYLRHKFGLEPIDPALWRFARLRPQSFPHLRLSQLARLYHERRTGLSQLIAQPTADDMGALLRGEATDYWQHHFTFGGPTARGACRLSAASTRLLLINTAAPMLFAYGHHQRNEQLQQRAQDLLEQLPAEDNHIMRMWKACGLTVDTAADSQALIQLKTQYCDRHDCLRCRIGYEYLRKRE